MLPLSNDWSRWLVLLEVDVKAVAPFDVLVSARRLDQVLVRQEPEDGGDDDADTDAVDEYHVEQKLKGNLIVNNSE